MKSPIKWHGGKTYLADKLIALMPPHTRYCEPFFGGGSVLLAKDAEGVSEAVNDLDRGLSDFWKVLRDDMLFPHFQRAIELTPFSEREFYDAVGDNNQSMVQRAVDFFVRTRLSRQGLGTSYATPSRRIRRGMSENVSAYLSAVEGLTEILERLRRVEIRCMDFAPFIKTYDSGDTLFYVDPPYPAEIRSAKEIYDHEMTAEQHGELLNMLSRIKGRFMLSGYDNELYRNYETLNNWICCSFEVPLHSSSAATKERKYELVWMNYAP